MLSNLKKLFPDNFEFYRSICDDQRLLPGKVILFYLKRDIVPFYIANFPTKLHWKSKSKIEYIKSGLTDLTLRIHMNRIKSIAIPSLGCGLGGLLWPEVKNMIKNSLAELTDVNILLYEPKRYI